MKTFKGFISEESRDSYDTKSYIFDKYVYPALILSPTALKRVFGNLNKIKAWHVTEQYEIDTLVSVSKVKSPHPRFIYKFSSEFKIKPYRKYSSI